MLFLWSEQFLAEDYKNNKKLHLKPDDVHQFSTSQRGLLIHKHLESILKYEIVTKWSFSIKVNLRCQVKILKQKLRRKEQKNNIENKSKNWNLW